MSERPYSRVYWEILDDPRFETIRTDVRHVGTWTLLLICAEMAWPVPAYLPGPSVPKASVKALATAGLIELRSGSRYIVHGLDAERGRRSAKATHAASQRWAQRDAQPMQAHPSSNAPSNAQPMLERERAKNETRRVRADAPASGEDDAAVALADRTGSFPRGRLLAWVNDLGAKHGEARLCSRIRSTPMTGDVRDYLEGIGDTLRREDHAATKAEGDAERVRVAEKRAKPTPLQPAPRTLTKEEEDAELRGYFAKEGAPA